MSEPKDRIDEVLHTPATPEQYAEQKRVEDAWRSVLGTRQGRVILRDILSICHFGRSAYAGDRDATHILAGKQKVGEYIIDMQALVRPEAYALMTTEATEDRKHDDRDAPDNNPNASRSSGSAVHYDARRHEPARAADTNPIDDGSSYGDETVHVYDPNAPGC